MYIRQIQTIFYVYAHFTCIYGAEDVTTFNARIQPRPLDRPYSDGAYLDFQNLHWDHH